jgi:hypothetical protein
MPQVERAEQMIDNEQVEEGVGDRHGNVDLSASLNDQRDDGWSEQWYGGDQWYGGEDSDEFDRGYTVEGRIEPHMIDGFLHGEESRQFRSKVWDEFTKIHVGGVVTKGQCVH